MSEPKRYDKKAKREYSKAEDRVTALLQAQLDKIKSESAALTN